MTLRIGERAEVVVLSNPHLPCEFIDYAVGLSEIAREPSVWLSHAPIHTVAQTQQIIRESEGVLRRAGIDQLPQSLKTITLGVKQNEWPVYYLVSGKGDFRLTDQVRQTIGMEIGASNKLMRRAVINPPAMRPEYFVGLPSGIVLPLVRRAYDCQFPGAFLLRSNPEPEYTTIAASLEQTLVLGSAAAALAINWWHERISVNTFLKTITG